MIKKEKSTPAKKPPATSSSSSSTSSSSSSSSSSSLSSSSPSSTASSSGAAVEVFDKLKVQASAQKIPGWYGLVEPQQPSDKVCRDFARWFLWERERERERERDRKKEREREEKEREKRKIAWVRCFRCVHLHRDCDLLIFFLVDTFQLLCTAWDRVGHTGSHLFLFHLTSHLSLVFPCLLFLFWEKTYTNMPRTGDCLWTHSAREHQALKSRDFLPRLPSAPSHCTPPQAGQHADSTQLLNRALDHFAAFEVFSAKTNHVV